MNLNLNNHIADKMSQFSFLVNFYFANKLYDIHKTNTAVYESYDKFIKKYVRLMNYQPLKLLCSKQNHIMPAVLYNNKK